MKTAQNQQQQLRPLVTVNSHHPDITTVLQNLLAHCRTRSACQGLCPLTWCGRLIWYTSHNKEKEEEAGKKPRGCRRCSSTFIGRQPPSHAPLLLHTLQINKHYIRREGSPTRRAGRWHRGIMASADSEAPRSLPTSSRVLQTHEL